MIIILVLILLIVAFSFYAYNMTFRAPKRTDHRQYRLPQTEQYLKHEATVRACVDEMLTYSFEEVYITSYDGAKLFGRYYHSQDGAPVHIMFHGYKSNPYLEFCGGCKLMRKLGHNVIIVDQRSHGKSSRNTITFGIKERKDCLAWINYAINRFGDSTKVLLWGISMGAGTILMSTDLDLPQNVVGIIADCPFSSPKEIIQKVCIDKHMPAKLLYPFVRLGALLFGHFNLEESCATKAVTHANIPILIFHGDDDRFVPHEMSVRIQAAAPDKITLETIPTAGHGLCYMVNATQYEKVVLDYINKVTK